MTSTMLWLFGLLVTVIYLRYLWREYRYDYWTWALWWVGRRAGIVAELERQRRQDALTGEHFIAEVRHRWDGLA